MTDNLPMTLDQVDHAIVTADVEERGPLDQKIAVCIDIAKRIGLQKEQIDNLAEKRIRNLRLLGEALDGLRVEGSLGRMRNTTKYVDLNITRAQQIWADEIESWPIEKQNSFIQKKKDHDNEELNTKEAYREAKNYRLDKMRRESNLDIVVEHEDVTLFNAPFENVLPKLPKESIELVFTDPPYDEASIPLFGTLAELSEPIMPEGASLLTYFGHYSAPRVLSLMTPHLKFWWLIAINQTGPRRTLEGKNVWIHWKPMAWFVKGGRGNNELVDDAIFSRMPGKEQHEWEQHTDEFLYYIQRLTDVDQTVLDPMMGSGTTGIAALDLGRKFIGIEQDPIKFAQASERIQKWIDNRGT